MDVKIQPETELMLQVFDLKSRPKSLDDRDVANEAPEIGRLSKTDPMIWAFNDSWENRPKAVERSDLESLQLHRRCKSTSNITVQTNSASDAIEMTLTSIASTGLADSEMTPCPRYRDAVVRLRRRS
ncbi:uncharacterized protein LOC111028892 [Myzus persicae]|uniref:uncharacterized protein LOC111028892 n=1 Tax=Myzus persicae TaxID=13164 RepID=UPI000B9370F5|nr:uncharacterized protein LOC111028892 [Myzus persicae]